MIPYDMLIGSATPTPQYGLLGMVGDRRVALDLNQPQTICIVGSQGSGKSYAAGAIAEMAVARLGVNVLPAPLAVVVFHTHRSDAYTPEFAAMNQPNTG